MQSQEYGVAKFSVGQRASGLTDAAVEQALTAGTILRTHLLRPTWHFVLSADIRWMTELTRPRVHAQNAYPYRRFGLDDVALGRTNQLLAASLSGTAFTRKEVAARDEALAELTGRYFASHGPATVKDSSGGRA